MDECGAFAWARTALRDGFGVDERAKFIVGGVGCDRLVVAEELPLWEVVQVQLGFELGEVGERRTLPKLAFVKLRASLLHADFEAEPGSESNGTGLPFSTLYCRIQPRCD